MGKLAKRLRPMHAGCRRVFAVTWCSLFHRPLPPRKSGGDHLVLRSGAIAKSSASAGGEHLSVLEAGYSRGPLAGASL
jgi:hypothetical protein